MAYQAAVGNGPDEFPVVLFGHSQEGGVVISAILMLGLDIERLFGKIAGGTTPDFNSDTSVISIICIGRVIDDQWSLINDLHMSNNFFMRKGNTEFIRFDQYKGKMAGINFNRLWHERRQ